MRTPGWDVGRARELWAQGERVALAHSETVPAGTRMEFEVLYMDIEALDGIIEWLDYGVEHGLGQWRNSGHGRFVYAAYDGRGRKVAGELDE